MWFDTSSCFFSTKVSKTRDYDYFRSYNFVSNKSRFIMVLLKKILKIKNILHKIDFLFKWLHLGSCLSLFECKQLYSLTHFIPLVSFYTNWKHHKLEVNDMTLVTHFFNKQNVIYVWVQCSTLMLLPYLASSHDFSFIILSIINIVLNLRSSNLILKMSV